MKTSDRITGIIMLIVFSSLLAGGLAGVLNIILYNSIGANGVVKVEDIVRIDSDKYSLKYIYDNEISHKSYIVERSINEEEYENVKKDTLLRITYVGYFPGSPHIEKIDSNNSLYLALLGIVILSIVIWRNILFLKGKIPVRDFI